MLWPEDSEQHAHGNLRAALWRLRRSHLPLLTVSGDSLALLDDVVVDVHGFIRCATDVVRRFDQRIGDDALTVLTAGELLPGWYDDDWVFFERERLRQLRLHALELLSDHLRVHARHAEALEAALAAVRVEPLRESAHRAVIRIHLSEGNVIEAVRQYDYFRSLLRRELETQPTEQIVTLIRPFLRGVATITRG